MDRQHASLSQSILYLWLNLWLTFPLLRLSSASILPSVLPTTSQVLRAGSDEEELVRKKTKKHQQTAGISQYVLFRVPIRKTA